MIYQVWKTTVEFTGCCNLLIIITLAIDSIHQFRNCVTNKIFSVVKRGEKVKSMYIYYLQFRFVEKVAN